MEIRLLGPVELHIGGQTSAIGPPQQRLAFAALAVDAGRSVTADTLIDRVWDEAPPGARRTLQVHLTRIRRLLEQSEESCGRLVRRSGGYLLDIDAECVDVHRFRKLMQSVNASGGTDAAAVAALRQARALWRGEPLAGLTGGWAARCRQSWRQEYLDATVTWAQAELEAGTPAVVVGPLSELASEYPLMEPLAAVLLRALCDMGRPAQALERYAVIRRCLADELGADPSTELQTLYQAILRRDGTTSDAEVVGRPAIVPAQLPAALSAFAGRRAQLARLNALLAGSLDRPSSAVLIVAIAGTAGVGKSTLAVHWAHTVAEQFPDGQLYVNLRGFDPAEQVMTPGEAVRGFLDALGVPPQRTPAHLDAQVALYRSILARKRVLVVVDNARDAEHARPLIPGTAPAAVVVTSRNQLTGLLSADGAYPLTLDILCHAEARELLSRRLGAQRVAAEPDALQVIVTACARLPLALGIAAARAQQTTFPLANLAAKMTNAGERLGLLDTGDPTSQVRAVFSWSVAALAAPAARLFRLLGLHPGPDISLAAAASLAGLSQPEVGLPLTELTDASLLTEHAPGRYSFHDLLRDYAAELTRTRDPEDTRRQATLRLLDHYTHTAYAAERLINPYEDTIIVPLARPAAGCTPEPLATHQAAITWLTAEHTVLLSALRHATESGLDTHTWQLAWSQHTFLYRQGRWNDRVTVWQSALRAARRLDDPAALARAHRRLAHAYTEVGRHAEALTHLTCTLDLYTRAGDRIGQARAHDSLAELWGRQGRMELALVHAQQALALSRSTGNRRGQASALNSIALCRVALGDHTEAVASCDQAIAWYQQAGDRHGEGIAWDSLGQAHQHAHHHAQAVDCYHRALTLLRESGSRGPEADTLTRLGDTHLVAGSRTAACTAWTRALEIFTVLDDAAADATRAKLARCANGGSTVDSDPSTGRVGLSKG